MWIILLISTAITGIVASPTHNVGPRECAKGEEFWCTDLRNAKSCGAVRYCIDNVWKKMSLPKDDSEMCDTCKKYVGELENFLETATKQEVENRILALCKAFPKYADYCNEFVTVFFNEIYYYLNTNFNPTEVCSMIGFCDETNMHIPQMPAVIDFYLEKTNDVECSYCQQIVQYLIDAISINTTEEEIKQILLGFCKHLGSWDQQCEAFVNESFSMIFNFIVIELQPKAVCTALDLCSQSSHGPRSVPLMTLMPSKPHQLDSNDVSAAPRYSRAVHVRTPLSKSGQSPALHDNQVSSIPCEICEYVLHDIQIILDDNETEELIKDGLEKVCDVLPKSIVEYCVDFIDLNGKQIIALIADDVDPSVICVKLRLCKASGIFTSENPAKPKRLPQSVY